jgi:hypothetical protein
MVFESGFIAKVQQFPWKKSLAIRNPMPTPPIVVIKPGNMNEWLSKYLPIRVVPLRSNCIAAMSVP